MTGSRTFFSNLLGAYTWSKSLDNASGLQEINPFNASLSKELSTFDMTNNFVTSYNYNLPFQKLAMSRRGFAHNLLDGWQVSGITRFTTGLPAGLGESGDLSLCNCGTDVPNYNNQPIQFFNPRTASGHRYFSPAPFSTEVLGVTGNANREFFHGPGLNDWDIALHKTTQITEHTSVEVRFELFDAFNHAEFVNPGGNLSSPNFGDVTAARNPRIGQVAAKFYF